MFDDRQFVIVDHQYFTARDLVFKLFLRLEKGQPFYHNAKLKKKNCLINYIYRCKNIRAKYEEKKYTYVCMYV